MSQKADKCRDTAYFGNIRSLDCSLSPYRPAVMSVSGVNNGEIVFKNRKNLEKNPKKQLLSRIFASRESAGNGDAPVQEMSVKRQKIH